jgi:hypothetical protein
LRTSGNAIKVAAAIGLVVAAGVIVSMAPSHKDLYRESAASASARLQAARAPADPSGCGGSPRDAFLGALPHVRRALEPNPAKFDHVRYAAEPTGEPAECLWLVRGSVDTENQFGGSVRRQWVVMMEYRPGSKGWAGEMPLFLN